MLIAIQMRFDIDTLKSQLRRDFDIKDLEPIKNVLSINIYKDKKMHNLKML